MSGEIRNKVAESGLIQLDLERLIREFRLVTFDITPFLYKGFALKEKEFRAQIAAHDWSVYADKYVAILLNEEAIIPAWAYMLISSKLLEAGVNSMVGSKSEVQERLVVAAIDELANQEYEDQRVLVRGCGHLNLGPRVYAAVTNKLQPIVKTLMFGEACSAVPVYKR